MYTYFLQRRADNQILVASTPSPVRVINSARTSYSPINPTTSSSYYFAFFIGILIPGGIILLRNLLNDKIEDKQTLEKLTKAPILGLVGVSHFKSDLIVLENPKSHIAEGFRAIRTAMQYMNHEKTGNVIMITSSVSSEGKSFCSLNLASIIAISGEEDLTYELRFT